MASYRLHCWVSHAEDLPFPKLGGWAPCVELKCGLGVAKSDGTDVVMFQRSGKGAPVFKYYLRIAVVTPLVNDVVVTLYNSKAIGKGKIGSALVPIKNLIRGVPVGFRNFWVMTRKGKPAGQISMRLVLQYPETVTLRPNPMSRDALLAYKHRGAPTLLLLGVKRIEDIKAPHGLKMNVVNFDTKIQALYPKAVRAGTLLDDYFWVDLRNKTVDLTFKVKKLASWIKVGTCHVNLQIYNSGDVLEDWHPILNRDIEVGRVRLSIQMQFYHSVLLPPECTLKMLDKYKEQIFATNSVYQRVTEEESIRLATKRSTAAKANKPAVVAPINISVGEAPKRSSSLPNTPASGQQRIMRHVSSHHDVPSVVVDDEASAAARRESLELERAIEESKRLYEMEQERAFASARNSLIDVRPHAPAGPAPVSAYGSGAVAVSLGERRLQRMPSTNPDFASSGSDAAAASANSDQDEEYSVEDLERYHDSDDPGDPEYFDGYGEPYPAYPVGNRSPPAAAVPAASTVMLQPVEMSKQDSHNSLGSQQSHGELGREMFHEAMSEPDRAAYYRNDDDSDSDSDSDDDQQGGGEPTAPPPAAGRPLPAAAVQLDTSDHPDFQGSPRSAAAAHAGAAAEIAKALQAARVRARLEQETSQYAHIRRDVIID